MNCPHCHKPMKREPGEQVVLLRMRGYTARLYTCETDGCEAKGRTFTDIENAVDMTAEEHARRLADTFKVMK